jgi:hypothetical protein
MRMKRTPFRPKKGKTWKRLRPINPNNKTRFVPASVLKQVKERSGGRCERLLYFDQEGKAILHALVIHLNPDFLVSAGVMHGLPRCSNKTMKQPHHILKRSQGGKHALENLKDLCFECHNWVESHPKEAQAEGLHKPYKNLC